MTTPFDPSAHLARLLFNLCLSVPWEKYLVKPKAPPYSSQAPHYPPPPRRPRQPPAPYAAPPAPAPRPAYTPSPVAFTPSSGPSTPSQTHIDRPGCTAADEAAVALFHLDGLARGKGGFGVLRVSKERLETAAAAAEGIKHPEIAAEYRAIAAEMPDVHTPEAAQALHDRLQPVVYDQSWDLGRKCKGALTPIDMAEIKALADKITARNKE